MLNFPVRVALAMSVRVDSGLPTKEIPSEVRVKYEEPKVSVPLPRRLTFKLRLERETVLVTGQVPSGNSDELGPV